MSTIERKARLSHERLMEAAGFSPKRIAEQVVEKGADRLRENLAGRTAGGKELQNPRDFAVDDAGDLVFTYDVDLPDDVADVD